MRESESLKIDVRGLQYHCRIWGDVKAPKIFMLHGFQDVSASWQFTVDNLVRDWCVVAPDWRGYGLTEWTREDTYWMPDFVADLDRLLDHFEPDAPATLVGHSMGANVAAIYAGVIPGRIHKFVNVEGIGGPPAIPEETPQRYARWLRQLGDPMGQRPYSSFEEFADRMMAENPYLTAERAEFLVRHLGTETDDGFIERSADPKHMAGRPTPGRLDEAIACWRRISAPTLWVEGAESRAINALVGVPEGYEERMSAFQTLEGLQRVNNAGHNVHHDQPEELARLIEGFL